MVHQLQPEPLVNAAPVLSGVSAVGSSGGSSSPFQMTMHPDRLSGTLNLTSQDEADEVIKMLTAMKVFLKPKEAAN